MQNFDSEEDNTFSTSATTVGQNQQLDLETDSKNKDFYIFLKQNMLLRHNQSEKSVILKEGVCKLKCYTCGNKFPNIKNCLKKVHQINDENCNKTCGYPNERDLRSKNLTTNRIKRTEQAKAKREKTMTDWVVLERQVHPKLVHLVEWQVHLVLELKQMPKQLLALV